MSGRRTSRPRSRRAATANRDFKDGRPANVHPLNRGLPQDRVPLFEAYLRFAEILALRSTDGLQQVGCVLVSFNLERVLGIGYNGGAAGIDDARFRPAGRSGYIHAEVNALLKTGSSEKDKVMFCTHAPCVMCAKATVNSGISFLYYRTANVKREEDGLALLKEAGVTVVRYPRWQPAEGERATALGGS